MTVHLSSSNRENDATASGQSLESIRVVEAFYAALGRGDYDAAFTLLADDFELIQADSLPYGGTWRGAEGVRDFFGALFGTWARFGSRETRYMADAETVVAISIAEGETKAGQPFEMPMVQIYHIRDGKLTSARPFYFDTAALNRAVGFQPA